MSDSGVKEEEKDSKLITLEGLGKKTEIEKKDTSFQALLTVVEYAYASSKLEEKEKQSRKEEKLLNSAMRSDNRNNKKELNRNKKGKKQSQDDDEEWNEKFVYQKRRKLWYRGNLYQEWSAKLENRKNKKIWCVEKGSCSTSKITSTQKYPRSVHVLDEGWNEKFWEYEKRRKTLCIEKGECSKNRADKPISASSNPPQAFQKKIAQMNGTKPRLVIEKVITKTDVEDGSSRLSIPQKQTLFNFLKPHELRRNHTLQVKIIEPCLDVSNISFTQWEMQKENGNLSIMYAFRTNWNLLKKKNKLKKGDIVQVWSFRVQEQLCFALVKKN